MNENKKWIIISIIVISILIFGILLGKDLFGRESVPNNGDGAESINTELKAAAGEQQVINQGIQSAEDRAESITRAIQGSSEFVHRAEERASTIEGLIEQSDALDKSSERILREVQAREPLETKKD